MKDNLKYFNQDFHLLQQKVQKTERFHQRLEMGSVYKSQAAFDHSVFLPTRCIFLYETTISQ